MNRRFLSQIPTMFLVLGSLPLLFNLPRLYHIWIHSPLDRSDCLFFLLFLLFFTYFLRKSTPVCGLFLPRPLPLRHLCFILPSLGGILWGIYHQINPAILFFCILFWLTGIWIARGWPYSYRLFPLFLLLCLAIPSSNYWISTFLVISYPLVFILKAVLAACFIQWSIGIDHGRIPIPRPESHFFCLLLVLSLLFLWQSNHLNILGDGFCPSLPPKLQTYWGIKTVINENTRRFYATSQISQYRYHHRTEKQQTINVLHVRCGTNIHEIHPASFCLTTARWKLLSEKLYPVSSTFQVTELQAMRGSTRMLVWVWYSSPSFSTPSFLCFRKNHVYQDVWQAYQVSTPFHDNITVTRQNLKNFLSELKTADSHVKK